MKNQNVVIGCVVSAVVAGGAGFYGGTLYQKAQRTAGRGQFTAGVRGAAGQTGGAAGARNAAGSGPVGMGMRGGAINGEVTAKDDKSLTIKMADGSSKIVILSGATTYRRTTDSSIGDIEVGTKVSTFGSTNTDGSVTAQNVQIDPMMPVASPAAK